MTSSLKLISSMATRRVLEELLTEFERRSGTSVMLHAMGGIDAAKLVRAGTDADVVVLTSSVMMRLEAEGYVVAGSRRDVARSGIAVAVRAGAAHPSIADEEDVRFAMLAGKIGYSTGPSGDHLKALWVKWGITDDMERRAVQAPPGVPVGEMLAHGDVTLGIQQLSELRDVPGIEIVGPLPQAIQSVTVFTAGMLRGAQQDAADLIAFLGSPETADAKREFGLDAP